VAEHEYLLDKVTITVDSAQVRANDLKPFLRQQPNYKIFGILKWPLYVYGWSGRNENNWLNKQLRRIGEPPEILDTRSVTQSQAEFKRYMTNKGFIHADVTATIDTSKRKKATVSYQIAAGQPHRLANYTASVTDVQIDSIFNLQPPKSSWFGSLFRSGTEEYTSLIQEGALFDRNVLDKERQRLTALLRQRGYYAFNNEHITFLADTSRQNLVDLEMAVKPVQLTNPAGLTEEQPHRVYYINQVKVITDYDNLNPEQNENFIPVDSAFRRNISIYYGQAGRSLRPSVLQRRTYLYPGMLYNEKTVEQTYQALSALRALRHVNIRYDELEENDSLKLDVTILTSPAKTHGFGVEIEGTNSAGDLGFASSFNYQHRNLFKGSEMFSARLRGAYESLSIDEAGQGNYWEFAGEASLLFPTFIFPVGNEFRTRVRASTELKISYNQQRRPEYRRAILSGGWSYMWQNLANPYTRHTFKLYEVNYVFLPYMDIDFVASLPEAIVLYNYSDLFIAGSGYTYSFNNYDPLRRGRNTYSFRFTFESAGNLLYSLSNLFDAPKTGGRYRLFGINYSQYVKGDVDFAGSIRLDNRNSIAFHVGGGIGYPYGNTKELPFERRYFSGGANSNRGWSIRSLGPGSMPITENSSFVYRVGDIRLDANIEYRSKLFWKFEMAAYIDAGNVWTIRPYSYQPKGNFDFTRFYKEIAMSYGLGFRLDFDYFLVRLDTGMKAFNPQAEGNKKWAVLDPLNLRENFAWHFAVGYPF
jgi:outer membrane protein assembly factor BamA